MLFADHKVRDAWDLIKDLPIFYPEGGGERVLTAYRVKMVQARLSEHDISIFHLIREATFNSPEFSEERQNRRIRVDGFISSPKMWDKLLRKAFTWHYQPKKLKSGDPCPNCGQQLLAFSPSGKGIAACDRCQTYWENN